MDWVLSIVQSLIVGAFAGGGAYAAIRVEIRWMRTDIDELKSGLGRAHARIDDHIKKAA